MLGLHGGTSRRATSTRGLALSQHSPSVDEQARGTRSPSADSSLLSSSLSS